MDLEERGLIYEGGRAVRCGFGESSLTLLGLARSATELEKY